MYGVTPAVAKQCTTYSDNEKKVILRQAAFNPIPQEAINRHWQIQGQAQYPIEWGVEGRLPEDLQEKGYVAAKIHPPFDLALRLAKPADVTFALLDTSRVKEGETVRIHINEFTAELPGGMQVFPLGGGEHRLTCQPEGEGWRWKHVAVLVKEYDH